MSEQNDAFKEQVAKVFRQAWENNHPTEGGNSALDFLDEIEAWILSRRCKTCKWWNGGSNNGNHRVCDKLTGKMDVFNLDEYRADDMLDGSSGEYGIYTGPDFGCIHHEEKESSNA